MKKCDRTVNNSRVEHCGTWWNSVEQWNSETVEQYGGTVEQCGATV